MNSDDEEMVRALAAALVLPKLIQMRPARAFAHDPLDRAERAALAAEYAQDLVEALRKKEAQS